MNRHTGKLLSDLDHIRQSIIIIITTPLGSRVMRRDFGSKFLELVDAPMNKATQLLMYAACAGPIRKWEPRVRITRFSFSDLSRAGRPTLNMEGVRTDKPGNPSFSLSIPL